MTAFSQTPLLDAINAPVDLRQLKEDELPKLAHELRHFILHSVAQTGGHLSSNLGSVELTVALHYVFNTPEDRLVWDVGHQTYAHKILTSRKNAMHTLRKHGGLSGFPKRSESVYDTFGVGHSSTSISAALGMAQAFKIKGSAQKCVAIIGDGALSGGQAFEALNNAGASDADMLVILNDNKMSISEPVGALNNYLARLLSGGLFNTVKGVGEKVLSVAPPLKQLAYRVEEHVKGMFTPGTLFEELGFNYIGPIDGHDLSVLIPTIKNLQKLKGPRFLHIVTKKGQGYLPAEADPILYHGVSTFAPENGIKTSANLPAQKTYTQIFGDWLCDMAKADPQLVAITPAMCEGSGLNAFAKAFPQRFFDVAIAEQHAITFAAGLACEGLRPVVAIYSTFLQRGFDQLIHDVALQNLPVVFAIDRGGLVGADGPTHHGAFDLSFLLGIPNLLIMCAADENECRQLLSTAYAAKSPAAVRYPRGFGSGKMVENNLKTLALGKGEIVRVSQEKKVALLVFGSLLEEAQKAAEEIDATVANMRFVKPIDKDLIVQLAQEHQLLVCLEENAVISGAGGEIARVLNEAGIKIDFMRLGLPDRFIEHGETKRLLAEIGLDKEGILQSIHDYQKHLLLEKK